jgi:acylpyruvate hydrolase
VRLATIRVSDGTAAVRVDDDAAVEIGADDVGALLSLEDWRSRAAAADGPRHDIDDLDYAPLIVRPEKIFCVGLNYRSHILEMSRDLPDYPTLFAKFTRTIIGANDDIVLPRVSERVDWEAELAVIIGRAVRHVPVEEAGDAIAGFAVLNDVSVRDYQSRTLQWLQGKAFEATTPLGPWLVTTGDDGPDAARPDLQVTCEVGGEQMQKAETSDLVFDPAALVSYISDIITLVPGDVIATGTPGGVGAAHKPPRFLADGDVVVTRISGLGECRNTCRREPAAE